MSCSVMKVFQWFLKRTTPTAWPWACIVLYSPPLATCKNNHCVITLNAWFISSILHLRCRIELYTVCLLTASTLTPFQRASSELIQYSATSHRIAYWIYMPIPTVGCDPSAIGSVRITHPNYLTVSCFQVTKSLVLGEMITFGISGAGVAALRSQSLLVAHVVTIKIANLNNLNTTLRPFRQSKASESFIAVIRRTIIKNLFSFMFNRLFSRK